MTLLYTYDSVKKNQHVTNIIACTAECFVQNSVRGPFKLSSGRLVFEEMMDEDFDVSLRLHIWRLAYSLQILGVGLQMTLANCRVTCWVGCCTRHSFGVSRVFTSEKCETIRVNTRTT